MVCCKYATSPDKGSRYFVTCCEIRFDTAGCAKTRDSICILYFGIHFFCSCRIFAILVAFGSFRGYVPVIRRMLL